MKLGKNLAIAFAMLFLSHTAFAALLIGPNCVAPTNVTIAASYSYQPVTKATVPGWSLSGQYQLGFEGFAFNCPKSAPLTQTQWVTFLMKGTNYFNAVNNSDHAVVIARGGNFTSSTYRGIGTIFSNSKYGASGEYFTNGPTEYLQTGCQNIVPAHSFSGQSCTAGVNPNNVSMADNKYYQVTIHASGDAMGYVVKDASTGAVIASNWIDHYHGGSGDLKNGARPDLFEHGGLSFWALWKPNQLLPGASIEYSEIATGWF